MTFTRRTHFGFYSFAVDIHYGFGLDLPLLFTKKEAFRAMAVSKVGITRILLRDELNRYIVATWYKSRSGSDVPQAPERTS